MEAFFPEKSLILLIDDSSYDLHLFRSILEGAKYEVISAVIVQQALEQIESQQPDLILLDLMMPRINGLEVCRLLKTDDRYRDIPVIFLTASHESEHLIEAFQIGAVDYITKPFNTPELLARVKIHLELKHAKDQLKKALGELEYLALTDSLTHIPNRRHLYQIAEREFARASRYHSPFSILMLDIDHFKQVNDRYGHLIGDEVIRSVATIIQNSLRREDCVARFGGEEFVILLPGTDTPSAMVVANWISGLIASVSFANPTHSIAVTVSIGIATFRRDDRDLDSLLGRADKALLCAKRQGRDRCIVHSADLDTGATV
jgi:diguanylate cyclase (GGDEF)-like protein